MRKVTELKICGQSWRVLAVSDDDMPGIVGSEGVTEPRETTIYLREGSTHTRMRDTLLHEVAHAVLEASGATYMLKEALPKNADADAFEETLIRVLIPHVVNLVADNGAALWSVPEDVPPVRLQKSAKARPAPRTLNRRSRAA